MPREADAGAFEVAWAVGHAMTADEALAFALAATPIDAALGAVVAGDPTDAA